MRDKSHHLRLEALLVNLKCYQVTFDAADHTQQMWSDIIDGANTELPGTSDEDIKLPTYEHVTSTITYPITSRPLPAMVANYPHV
jgi:hypothetical protein